jgi:myo-inositol-1-phosphate synthase
LFENRGVVIDHTYQLNFGGNMDFKNMLERSRLKSKKISKTQSVTSQITSGIDAEDIHIGPSDHVPWLKDRKWAYIRIEGREFGDIPVSMELKLEVWDSPNSAGVVIDAVRCAKLAMDRGIGGPLIAPSAYFMKSPPVQFTDAEAVDLVEDFIAQADRSEAEIAPSRNGNGANGHHGNGHRISLGVDALRPTP